MARGVDLNVGIRPTHPSLPLGVAVEAGAPLDIIDRLLVTGIKLNLAGNWSAFLGICASGRREVLKMLVHCALPDHDANDPAGER